MKIPYICAFLLSLGAFSAHATKPCADAQALRSIASQVFEARVIKILQQSTRYANCSSNLPAECRRDVSHVTMVPTKVIKGNTSLNQPLMLMPAYCAPPGSALVVGKSYVFYTETLAADHTPFYYDFSQTPDVR